MLPRNFRHKKNVATTTLNFIMGRLTGIEPANVGTTNQCVNHFTTTAMTTDIIIALK